MPALLAIYNDLIATSTAIYMDDPETLDGRTAWWHARVAAGYPVLVAEDQTGVVGFASFGDLSLRSGYRFSVEDSVYVRADRRGSGIGRILMLPLIDRATALGKHVLSPVSLTKASALAWRCRARPTISSTRAFRSSRSSA